MAKIEKLLDAVRHERDRWTPVRRGYLPQKNGKRRPLGLPTWTDKLLQEVIRSILDAYYEPQFTQHAHGFRPARGGHTAFGAVGPTWKGSRWDLEGASSPWFDRVDHSVLLSSLAEKLLDHRFLRVIQHLLQAGDWEDWRYTATLSGSPQGGVVSPILSNIYLDQVDPPGEQVLIPA